MQYNCFFFFTNYGHISVPSEDDEEITTFESLQLPFDTLKVAKNDFSDSKKLGEGGFGAVYQVVLSDEYNY